MYLSLFPRAGTTSPLHPPPPGEDKRQVSAFFYPHLASKVQQSFHPRGFPQQPRNRNFLSHRVCSFHSLQGNVAPFLKSLYPGSDSLSSAGFLFPDSLLITAFPLFCPPPGLLTSYPSSDQPSYFIRGWTASPSSKLLPTFFPGIACAQGNGLSQFASCFPWDSSRESRSCSYKGQGQGIQVVYQKDRQLTLEYHLL